MELSDDCCRRSDKVRGAILVPGALLVLGLVYLLSYGVALRVCTWRPMHDPDGFGYWVRPKWMKVYRPVHIVIASDFRSHLSDKYDNALIDYYRSYLERCDRVGWERKQRNRPKS
jgi:hypothetical protein